MRTVIIIIIAVIVYTLAAVLTARKAYKNGLETAKKLNEVRKWKIQSIIAGVVFPLTLLTALVYIVGNARQHRKEW